MAPPRKRRRLIAVAVGATLIVAAAGAALAVPHSWRFSAPSGDRSDEPSGLAASRKNPGYVLWENEAPRDGMGMLYAVNSDGLQKTFEFAPTGKDRPTGQRYDFEDMAIGPCDGPKTANCVWVGDIGRVSGDFASSQKDTFWLYRMSEPNISSTADRTELTVTGRFPFTVPAVVANEGKRSGGSSASYDMEAMMVHPTTGEIFLVTKGQNNGGLIRIMAYPGPLTPGVSRELRVVKTIQMPQSADWDPATMTGESNHLVTGADISPDGRSFILRTYGALWEFTGDDFASALAVTNPVELPKAAGEFDRQGEAVAYRTDGRGYFTIGERSSTSMRFVVLSG